MLSTLSLRQSNSAIVRPTGVSASLTQQSPLVRYAPLARYGDRICAQIERGLVLHFNHRTRGGAMFVPRVIASKIILDTQKQPSFHAVVIHPETLYHYSLDFLTDADFLRALSMAIGKPVFACEYTPASFRDSLPRGICFIVALRDVKPADAASRPIELPRSVKLDLSRRPSALHVPIGVTTDKPNGLWLNIAEMDAVLIGGSRRMGKTNLIHAWIAALLDGGAVQLVLFDGKGGVEFGRYRGRAGVTFVEGKLLPALQDLYREMNRRLGLLRDAGAQNIAAYGHPLPRIALVVDELASALEESGVESLLVDLAGRGGAVGIHPILATNQCRAEVVTQNLKVNLPTRIGFAVPQTSDSRVILDAANAAHLPNIHGRLVLRWNALLIEAQAYEVDLPPAPTIVAEPVLSDRERQIAAVVLANRGEFKIADVARAVGETREEMTRIAREWEARGWLTAVQHTQKGAQPRQVTDTLLALVEKSNGA